MAEVERSRIRSVVQPVTHSKSPSTGVARSRSRSRSPYEKKKRNREDKENREKSDDNKDDDDKEYRRRIRHSDSDDDRKSYRRKDRGKYDSERRHDRDRRERRRRGSEDDRDYDEEADSRRHRKEHRSERRKQDTPSDDERHDNPSPEDRVEKDDTQKSNKRVETAGAKENSEKTDEPAKKKANPNNPLLTRTGGAYIPPARLKMMQESIEDKSSEAYQRLSWEALKKSINGLVNKVNTSNIGNIVRELFQENIVRGSGVLSQSIMRAQVASPTFTHVYAALVAILNTKFPKNGELLLRRLVLQFRRAYRRNDKTVCLSSTRFIAHLVNQQVAHEILALEILTLLLHKPTDDSVEVAIGFLKEVGMKLSEVSSRGVHAVFERLRNILHSAEIDKRVQYMIEVMFAIRKDGFKDHPAVPEGLDLVEEEDQITHLLRLEETSNSEDILNVFKFDPNFLENEEKYKEIKRDILGEGDSDESSGDDDDEDDDDDEEEENKDEQKMEIIDHTETNLVALRRTIYLTIQSSLDFEECAHKLLKMQIKPEQMSEFCTMIIDCCSQQRSYEKFFGLLAQRFCQINKAYMDEYITAFQEQYESIHRLETNKLRNVAKFFGHLLYTDAIPWTVLACIKLNEDDTTSSSRVFIKILFQELAEFMGLPKLNERLKDPFLAEYFEGIFPRDNPRNTRFSINFFTSVGLGGVTDELREHLKNAPKMIMAQKRAGASDDDSDSSNDSSSSSSSSEDSSSSEESSSESESSEESSDDDRKKRHKKKQAASKRKEKDTRKHKKRR